MSHRWIFYALWEWTVFFGYSEFGPECSWTVTNLTRRLTTEGAVIVTAPENEEQNGAVMLEVYGPLEDEAPKRAIACFSDGGRWGFTADGEAMWFEDEKKYRARRRRDRFTVEDLRGYLSAWGLMALETEYYAEAVVVERRPWWRLWERWIRE